MKLISSGFNICLRKACIKHNNAPYLITETNEGAAVLICKLSVRNEYGLKTENNIIMSS